MEIFNVLFKSYIEMIDKIGILKTIISLFILIVFFIAIKYGLKIVNYFMERKERKRKERIEKEYSDMIEIFKKMFVSFEIIPNYNKVETILHSLLGVSRPFITRLKQTIFSYRLLNHNDRTTSFLENELQSAFDNSVKQRLSLFINDKDFLQSVEVLGNQWIVSNISLIEEAIKKDIDNDDDFRREIENIFYPEVSKLSNEIYAEYSILILKEKMEHIKLSNDKKPDSKWFL